MSNLWDRLPAQDLDRGQKLHLQNQDMDWRTIPAIAEWLYGRDMAPEAEAHMRMMAAWGKMNVWDRDVFQKAMEMPFAGKSLRWIASIPSGVMALMLEANPTLLADKENFKKWLKDTSDLGGAKFLVPGAKL
jgi:hypothetical protein